MSTCAAMSGTFAAIRGLLGSKKWIIRDGLSGISRGGCGAPIAFGLKKCLGLSMTSLPAGWDAAGHPVQQRSNCTRCGLSWPGVPVWLGRALRVPVDSASTFQALSRGDSMSGKYFEEFEVGDVFEHRAGRTVTETDNLLFTTLTMNPQPLHLDAEFAKGSEFGERLVKQHLQRLGWSWGLSVGETTLGTTVGNLGFERVEFPNPVFIGDTITAATEVVGKRESKSHPEWGIVTFEHRGLNQRGELVARCTRAAMMLRKA